MGGSTRAQVDRWRASQRSEGLCIECINRAEPGRIRCQYHLSKQAEYIQIRRGIQPRKGVNK